MPILKLFENLGVFCCGSGGILRCVLRWICTKTWLCFDYGAEHGVFSGKGGIIGYWWSGFVPILKTHGTVWVFRGSDWSDIRLFKRS